MTAEARRDKPTRASISLFALLFAIGTCYLASLAYFLRHSTNFVERSGIEAATQAVSRMHSALPVTYTFDAKSPWTKSLAYGWNAPETWGVWASNTTAAVVLPPVPGVRTVPVCIGLRFGNVWSKRRLPLSIAVDGQPLGSPKVYSGQGPFEARGMVPVEAGQPVVIRFHGPAPVIPRAISRTNLDGRLLSFSLLGITIEPRC